MTPEPRFFTGEYRYTLDQKGRVNIPAKFRKILAPSNDKTFVITLGLQDDGCLIVRPVEEWIRIENNLSTQLNQAYKLHRELLRDQTRYATYCKYDSQGRITIPQSLIKIAGIKKEAIILGALKWIEIWDPRRLEKIMSERGTFSDEEMAALAEKIVL